MSHSQFLTDDRGVSSTIGFVLIMAMVVTTVGVLIGAGSTIMSESQETAGQEAIDQAMTQLDSQMSLVAFDGGDKQTIDLSAASDSQLTIENAGHITLELRDYSQPAPVETLIDRDLNALQYERENRVVAYQGGGVWSMQNGNPDTSEMVSPPEFTYKSNTATLPLISVPSDEDFSSSDGSITLTKQKTEGIFPQEDTGRLANPVNESQYLVLTIEGPYYQAWGDYFSDRMDITPEYDHDSNSVKVTLATKNEADGKLVSHAVTSVGGDRRILVNGQGTTTIVDSYNSTIGPYTSSQSENGSIQAESGITVQNGQIEGNVETTGEVILRGNARVTGDAAAEGGVKTAGGGTVEGDISTDASIGSYRPIDPVIESVRKDVEENNDNDDWWRIHGGEIRSNRVLNTQGDPTRITAGEYYLSTFNLNGEEVTFDLSRGDIEIVSDGPISWNNVDVNVINNERNDHRVQIYTRTGTVRLGGDVSVEGDEAGALWFYGGAGSNIHIKGTVTGVMYAPGTSESPGDVIIESHATLYGATIGGNTNIQNQAAYHYDEALRNTGVFKEQHRLDHISAIISYFHISDTKIEIDD